jgi:hypothetical protein
MNYEQALKLKVLWEKSFRPHIKENLLPDHKNINNANTNKMESARAMCASFKCLKEMRDESPFTKDETIASIMMSDVFRGYDTSSPAMKEMYDAETRNELLEKSINEEGYCEKIISHLETSVEGLGLAIKQQKKEIVLLSYIYNLDLENANKHFDAWKKISYLSQEWWEENHNSRGVEIGDEEEHNNENAYIEFMNREKESYETFQNLITIAKEQSNTVKPILKAGKRMNKRKNGKKNRGGVSMCREK